MAVPLEEQLPPSGTRAPSTERDPPRSGEVTAGTVIGGRYAVTGVLATGGMGTVYDAVQLALDRPVAIKCLGAAADGADARRFLAEARVLSSLSHPGIVRVYDFGHADLGGVPSSYLVMERLPGRSLAEWLAEDAALPPEVARDAVVQVLSALAEIHARGILHRDVKPANVVVVPDRSGRLQVKLVDFGIARASQSPALTAAGLYVGTPQYMAPELVRGEPASVATDLYAVGVTLFQLLTGVLPFDGPTPASVFEQHLWAPRPDVREFGGGAGCPSRLAAACARALALAPSDRFPSAEAFAEELAVSLVPSLRPAAPAPGSAVPVPTARSLDPRTPPPSSDRGELGLAERVERAARQAFAVGRLRLAEAELRKGLAIGHRALGRGDQAFGRACLLVFGRLLGGVERALGRPDAAAATLEGILPLAAGDTVSEGRILAELAETLGGLGRPADAEQARLAALRRAAAVGDRALTERLRRLAHAVGGAGAAPPSSGAPPAPLRQSTFLVRPGGGGPAAGARRPA